MPSTHPLTSLVDRAAPITGEVGIYTARNPDTVRGADVTVLSTNRRARIQSESYLDVAPERINEILSFGNRDADLDAKIEEYFGIGVDQLWVANPKEAVLHRYRAPNRVDRLTRENVLHEEDLPEGFQLPLAELFDLD